MMIKKYTGTMVLNLETMEYEDNSIIDCFMGGSGSAFSNLLFGRPSDPEPQKIISPKAPVDEAGLEMGADELDDSKKGKKSLKTRLKKPLKKVGADVGLKV